MYHVNCVIESPARVSELVVQHIQVHSLAMDKTGTGTLQMYCMYLHQLEVDGCVVHYRKEDQGSWEDNPFASLLGTGSKPVYTCTTPCRQVHWLWVK